MDAVKKNIKYITELTREDLAEIAAEVDPVPGFCISITREGERIKIGIDENALAMAINGFIRNGGAQKSAAAAVNVSFNPPS